jgi:hypothetical protein
VGAIAQTALDYSPGCIEQAFEQATRIDVANDRAKRNLKKIGPPSGSSSPQIRETCPGFAEPACPVCRRTVRMSVGRSPTKM